MRYLVAFFGRKSALSQSEKVEKAKHTLIFKHLALCPSRRTTVFRFLIFFFLHSTELLLQNVGVEHFLSYMIKNVSVFNL